MFLTNENLTAVFAGESEVLGFAQKVDKEDLPRLPLRFELRCLC